MHTSYSPYKTLIASRTIPQDKPFDKGRFGLFLVSFLIMLSGVTCILIGVSGALAANTTMGLTETLLWMTSGIAMWVSGRLTIRYIDTLKEEI